MADNKVYMRVSPAITEALLILISESKSRRIFPNEIIELMEALRKELQ